MGTTVAGFCGSGIEPLADDLLNRSVINSKREYAPNLKRVEDSPFGTTRGAVFYDVSWNTAVHLLPASNSEANAEGFQDRRGHHRQLIQKP